MDDALLGRIRAALESNDVDDFAALLDPACRWGAPDDDQPGCTNRRQVLTWYQRRYDQGVRAEVTEVRGQGDHVLVGLQVRGATDDGTDAQATARWQVLTVTGGLVTDIRGFDDRAEAARRAGIA